MKNLTIFLLLLWCGTFFAQHESGGELFIYNRTNQDIIVRVFPVSGVFNCDRNLSNFYGNYNLVMCGRSVNHSPLKDFISGTSLTGNNINKYWTLNPYQPLSDNDWISYGFDDVGGTDQSTAGTIGFGIWRVEFFWTCSDPEDVFDEDPCLPNDYVTIEFDYGYINANRQVCGDNFTPVVGVVTNNKNISSPTKN